MKRENSNRTRIAGLRFTPEEFKKMECKWKTSTCRKLSDYIRKGLFNKPVTTYYRNQSLDECLLKIIALQRELNALGNNFN
jgi:hypothetical protein